MGVKKRKRKRSHPSPGRETARQTSPGSPRGWEAAGHLAPLGLPGCHRCPDSEAAEPYGSLPEAPPPESGWLEKMLERELEEQEPKLEREPEPARELELEQPPGDPQLQKTAAYESLYLSLPCRAAG